MRDGWCVTGKCVRVVDSDTITVEIVRHLRVRITDKDIYVDGPELKTAEGKIAAKFTEKTLLGKEVQVFIPGYIDIQRLTSLSRLLAEVYIKGKSFGKILTKWLTTHNLLKKKD